MSVEFSHLALTWTVEGKEMEKGEGREAAGASQMFLA